MFVKAKHLKKRQDTVENDTIRNCVRYRQVGSDPKTIYNTLDRVVAIDRRRFVGWDIPEFHRRVREGELLPHTPFYQFSVTGSSEGVYDWTSEGDTRLWYAGNYPHFNTWQMTEARIKEYVPSSYDKYVTEAASKIYGQGFDALTSLAELKDVRRTFVNLAKGLKKLEIPNLLDWRKRTSNWLSLRYGWRPLIYDIVGLNEAIKNLNEKRTRFKERAGTKYTNTYVEYDTVEHSAYWTDHVITTQVETGIRGSVIADIEVPAFQFNPLQTGWELVPFSFVLDWFFTVGTALSAISFAVHQKAYAASAGYQLKVTRSLAVTMGDTKENFIEGPGQTQVGQSVAVLQVRNPCPIPYIPHFALKMNEFKVLDLISLILQRLKH